jgi:hypothetical protein
LRIILFFLIQKELETGSFIFGKMGYNLNRGQNMETEIEKKIREVLIS